MAQSHDFWSIILAGGEGERMRPFIEQWLGYPKPKQWKEKPFVNIEGGVF
jgi:mannose-1-phosphate guanylyltransferase